MNILATFAIAVGLSMDNFAVTIASGCGARGAIAWQERMKVALSFVLAHIVMFSAGWLGGQELGRLIDSWDHWVAFFVLVFIGVKMMCEAGKAQTQPLAHTLPGRIIVGLAIATSLDALGVGIALSLEQARFWLTLIFMSGCVFITSYTGFALGERLGQRFGQVMQVIGGLVLTCIGIKVLLSGLGIW